MDIDVVQRIDLIVPCFNEEACIFLFYDAVQKVFDSLHGYDFSIIYVDDGSSDHTLTKIKELAKSDEKHVKYISFARNFGKEAAMYAGLHASTADMAAIMDCDLQHPPELLVQMIEVIEAGYACCAAKRKNRKGEPRIRSFFAGIFYNVINRISTVKMIPGATDFRLMTRNMVDAILRLEERERFTKGLLSWVGFSTQWIEYENVERAAGQTTWSFFKLFVYAISGIVAFSTAPLRLASIIGIMVVFGAFLFAVYVLLKVCIFGSQVAGYTSVLIIMLFLNGIIISLLGIVGEYLARLYIEEKRRPLYITKETNLQ